MIVGRLNITADGVDVRPARILGHINGIAYRWIWIGRIWIGWAYR